MAIAGRVAIRPRGAYDPNVSYERLDMVKYQNTLFVAKKAVSGVTPVDGEHWMDCGGTDLSDIEKKITALENPEFTEAGELTALKSKESNTTLWGKVAKAVSSLIAHIGNKKNPHEVTASQVGALTEANIANSTVVTEAGFAADARQLNSEVEGSYAKGVAEQISGINDSLLKRINTQDAMYVTNLAAIKENGVFAVRNAEDMPNGNKSAVMEVLNTSESSNYFIQRVTYISEPQTIYQRRIHQEDGVGEWNTVISTNCIQTIPFFGEVSAYPEYYTIYANGVAILNTAKKTMDIHLSIIANKTESSIPENTVGFISNEKLSSLIGVTKIVPSVYRSFVKPCVDMDAVITAYAGYSGLLLSMSSNNNYSYARFYTNTGSAGGFPIDKTLYEKLSGIQTNIDIYGASYS